MLARAAVSIGLEVNRPPSPEPSRLDDWFLGAGRGSQPRSALVPFFPEVHEELTKSWMAPFTARSRSSASSILTTLDGGVARGYAGIPQVERAIAVHLCPRNAATWRNRPRLPSKACKLTAALADKAYSAAGQAASALHAMAILQVHQAKALKQVHEGSTDTGLMQELHTATDFTLRATKVTARSLGKAMSTMVVQECHLWLNLAEMKDVDKARFLDAPISQAGLFGDTVEGFAQQFSVLWRSSTSCPGVMHHPPLPPGPGLSLPVVVGALLRPPELLCPRLNRHIGRHVSLAHAHNSTRLRNSVHQTTSTAFSRRRWQSGTPLSCARRLLSSWQRMQSSRSLQLRWGRGFTALPTTSLYPRKVVAFGQSWICESWTGLCTSSRWRCWRTGAWSNAFSPRIGLQRSTWRTLTFTFRSFRDTDRFYGLHSKVGHGSTGSSPSGSPCLPVCLRRS